MRICECVKMEFSCILGSWPKAFLPLILNGTSFLKLRPTSTRQYHISHILHIILKSQPTYKRLPVKHDLQELSSHRGRWQDRIQAITYV